LPTRFDKFPLWLGFMGRGGGSTGFGGILGAPALSSLRGSGCVAPDSSVLDPIREGSGLEGFKGILGGGLGEDRLDGLEGTTGGAITCLTMTKSEFVLSSLSNDSVIPDVTLPLDLLKDLGFGGFGGGFVSRPSFEPNLCLVKKS